MKDIAQPPYLHTDALQFQPRTEVHGGLTGVCRTLYLHTDALQFQPRTEVHGGLTGVCRTVYLHTDALQFQPRTEVHGGLTGVCRTGRPLLCRLNFLKFACGYKEWQIFLWCPAGQGIPINIKHLQCYTHMLEVKTLDFQQLDYTGTKSCNCFTPLQGELHSMTFKSLEHAILWYFHFHPLNIPCSSGKYSSPGWNRTWTRDKNKEVCRTMIYRILPWLEELEFTA